jgi:hypothetical protein
MSLLPEAGWVANFHRFFILFMDQLQYTTQIASGSGAGVDCMYQVQGL